MTRTAFVIPRNRRYWRNRTPTAIELSRLIASARRCYPDVAFDLCEHPPRSQRYPKDSENEQIRHTLESMSPIDLGVQYAREIPPGWRAAGTELEPETPTKSRVSAPSLPIWALPPRSADAGPKSGTS
jgi:hypothetical protein